MTGTQTCCSIRSSRAPSWTTASLAPATQPHCLVGGEFPTRALALALHLHRKAAFSLYLTKRTRNWPRLEESLPHYARSSSWLSLELLLDWRL